MAHNGYIQLLGKTSLAASVTANGFAALRQGTEFSREVSFVNTAAPHLESLLTSDGSIFTTTEAFIPLATTSPSYDNDGNLTADGQFLYTWDALNRLILVRRSPAALTAGAPFAKVSYQYDAVGRMFLRQVFTNDTAATPSRSTYYLYRGWNCYAECESLSATPSLASAALARSHVWGLDLSSTMEGAGGVGGLVWTKNQGTGANHLVCQDGNGNVRKLINSSTFAISASYDYGPFGELLRASGMEAKANRYRFSAKPQDPVTGLLYYTSRWYDSTNGRWPSKDPIEEEGGINLYGFVNNDSVNRWDYLGLTGPHQEGSGLAEECCDEATINSGETELNERYKNISQQFRDDGVKPFGPRDAPNSCIMINTEVIERLAQNPEDRDGNLSGIPKCWDCQLENGRTDAKWRGIGGGGFKRYDHWVVVCKAYDQDGNLAKEIKFDFWNSHAIPGEDPNRFRKEYPHPGDPNINNPQRHQTCSGIQIR